jgi:alpha-galactosidase
MLAAPLMIGCDVRNMDGATRAILTNREAIAIDQDLLGKQGYRASRNGAAEIWKKPLADGQLTVGLFNRGIKSHSIPVAWSDLEIGGKYQLRDVWAQADMGVFDSLYRAEVESHGCALLRLLPVK